MKNLGLKMVEERIRKLEGRTEEFTQDKEVSDVLKVKYQIQE